MAKVKHISDGTNTWDVGGGTDVFSGEDIVHSTVKVTISGFTTGTYGSDPSTVIAQNDVTNISFTNEQGTTTEYTDLDTLYNSISGNNRYYEFEFINNSGNAMPSTNALLLNTSGGNSIVIQNNPVSVAFSGDDGPIGGLCAFKGYGTALIGIVSVTAEHYNELKIIDPLEVKKVNNVPCLTGPRAPKYFKLLYSSSAWKLTDLGGTTYTYDDLQIGDTVEISSSVQPLPSNVLVRSAYQDRGSSKPKEWVKYVSYSMRCRVFNVTISAGVPTEVILQAPPVNYATSQGDGGSNDGSWLVTGINASSSEDTIAEKLRYLKNVVEEDSYYTNHNYMLYGYDANGIIANLNTHIHRIVYDDGSFAAIYYPEAGTIPDGITPGFTSGAGSTPPAGNWQPLVAYDSVFFFSGNTKCSKGLQYNGQGFYGTPTSGTGVYFTSNTNYFIVFGHFNDQYMAIK